MLGNEFGGSSRSDQQLALLLACAPAGSVIPTSGNSRDLLPFCLSVCLAKRGTHRQTALLQQHNSCKPVHKNYLYGNKRERGQNTLRSWFSAFGNVKFKHRMMPWCFQTSSYFAYRKNEFTSCEERRVSPPMTGTVFSPQNFLPPVPEFHQFTNQRNMKKKLLKEISSSLNHTRLSPHHQWVKPITGKTRGPDLLPQPRAGHQLPTCSHSTPLPNPAFPFLPSRLFVFL